MFKKILVCLDGSALAEKAIPYAAEEAVHFESELVLFRVVSEAYLISLALPGIPGTPINAAGTEKLELQEEKEAREYLKSMSEKLQTEKNIQVSYDSAIGPAGPSIIEYCEKQEIELIAIATHGRSGPGRVILGSVADHVIRHSNLPILLIRPVNEK